MSRKRDVFVKKVTPCFTVCEVESCGKGKCGRVLGELPLIDTILNGFGCSNNNIDLFCSLLKFD